MYILVIKYVTVLLIKYIAGEEKPAKDEGHQIRLTFGIYYCFYCNQNINMIEKAVSPSGETVLIVALDLRFKSKYPRKASGGQRC